MNCSTCTFRMSPAASKSASTLLASWQRLAAMSPPLAPYASLSVQRMRPVAPIDRATQTNARSSSDTPRLQPPILEAACNERNRYLCEKCKRKNNHSMGTPPPVGFAASERAGARAREQLVLKTSALWEKQTYKCRNRLSAPLTRLWTAELVRL